MLRVGGKSYFKSLTKAADNERQEHRKGDHETRYKNDIVRVHAICCNMQIVT